jgi:glycosyltransferase involved in cell wall biosynthesis
MEKKRVLIIAYNFPPVGGAGVQRVSKFVKYLVRFNWESEVVTTANPSVPLKDDGLLSEIPDGVRVHRTKTLEPSYVLKTNMASADASSASVVSRLKRIVTSVVRFFLIPDPQILWWPHTAITLFKLLKSRTYNVIFASGPPFSSLVLSVFLGRFFGVPVVVDFRDEWSFSRNNWENSTKSAFVKWFDRVMEKWVVKNANAITVASPAYRTSFMAEYQKLDTEKIHVITNGYDPDDFVVSEHNGVEPDQEKRFFNFVYTGTVWKATSLKPFVQALEALLEERPELRNRIRVRVYGRVVGEEAICMEPLRLDGVISLFGYVDHKEVVREMQAADCLLLTLADLHGSDKIIPGKTFEFMVGKPSVLAIVPPGECSAIISSIPGFFVVHPNDDSSLKMKICELATMTNGNLEKSSSPDYSRIVLTEHLANVLSAVISEPSFRRAINNQVEAGG